MKWLIQSAIHGFFIFMACKMCLEGPGSWDGRGNGYWYISTIAFICRFHVSTLKCFIETINIDGVHLFWLILTVFVTYVIMLLFNVEVIALILQPSTSGIIFHMFTDIWALFVLFFIPIICLLPDYIWNTFWWLIRPNEAQKLLMYGEKIKI